MKMISNMSWRKRMKNKIIIMSPPVKIPYSKEEKAYNPDSAIITPNEISELQGSLQELNKDDTNLTSRTNNIDLRSRLSGITCSSLSIIDSLIIYKFLPLTIAPLCNSVKRLSVSLEGKGRLEIVDIVAGKRQTDMGIKQNKGFMGIGASPPQQQQQQQQQQGGYN
jgi:hypothetical protein